MLFREDIMTISELVKDKKALKFAYIGGSITEGAGASRLENRWTSRLTKALRERFPGTSFEEINAGIGGTESTYGLLRLKRDVLRLSPDVVFMEFSLNDESLEESLSKKSYEGLLRALMKAEKVPYVVLIGVVGNRDHPTRAGLHREIGKHYGLSMIDLQEEMDALLGKAAPGENKERDLCFTKDNVHPSDHGYEFYTERILAHVDEDIFRKPLMKEKKNPAAFDFNGKFVNAFSLSQSGTWEKCGEGDWDLENCGSHDAGLLARDPSASLTLDFYGGTVVVGHRIGTDFGRMKVTLDGEETSVECYYPTVNQPVTWFQRFSMEAGKHHLTIRPAGEKNEKSTDDKIKVDFVCVEEEANG